MIFMVRVDYHHVSRSPSSVGLGVGNIPEGRLSQCAHSVVAVGRSSFNVTASSTAAAAAAMNSNGPRTRTTIATSGARTGSPAGSISGRGSPQLATVPSKVSQ